MADYKSMYTHLFNSITTALTEIEHNNYQLAERVLKTAQCKTEELFIETEPRIEIALEKNVIILETKK